MYRCSHTENIQHFRAMLGTGPDTSVTRGRICRSSVTLPLLFEHSSVAERKFSDVAKTKTTQTQEVLVPTALGGSALPEVQKCKGLTRTCSQYFSGDWRAKGARYSKRDSPCSPWSLSNAKEVGRMVQRAKAEAREPHNLSQSSRTHVRTRVPIIPTTLG